MKLGNLILIGLFLVFIGIQFVPTELPSVESNNPEDIIQSGIVNEEVAGILKTSCYSCHSNETNYPWYSYMAPSSWLVAKDVREGRKELNFSTWQENDMIKKLGYLDDISSVIDDESMPMGIYTLMHPSAKLTEEQRELIVAWAEDAMDLVVEEDEEDWEEEG
ncbi:heme-binding domain-containing protein [Aquiflexum lacus]|uniref:heme-binding domain-containing protein n=1 Tax=Aquiflexum lacus TaxID=2483805 RepID=UPI001893ED74|nr:heme-binding domain-containing protein [Aquiflexum lacus]